MHRRNIIEGESRELLFDGLVCPGLSSQGSEQDYLDFEKNPVVHILGQKCFTWTDYSLTKRLLVNI